MTRLPAALVATLVGALAVLLVILFPTIMTRVHPPEARLQGEWRFTHVVDSSRWPVEQRILDENHEYTVVASASGPNCVVSTSRTTPDLDPTADSHRVRIGPRSGTYVDGPAATPEVVWSYAPAGIAEVRCSDEVPEETLIDLAEQVEFADSRIRLPFTVTALPTGYHVASIDERRGGAEVAVTLTPDPSLEKPSVIITYGGTQPSNRCIPTVGTPVCLTASWSAEELPSAPSRVRRSIAEVADRLEIVPDPGDPGTWFDAIDLPR